MKKLTKSLLATSMAALLLLSVCPAALAYWFTDEARAAAIPLTLDVPAPVHIPDPPKPDSGCERKWFMFTPGEDGNYWFAVQAETVDIVPVAWVYNDNGDSLWRGYGSTDESDGIFVSTDGIWTQWIMNSLEEGKTYYIQTSVLSWRDGGDYAIKVTRNAPDTTRRLVAPSKVTLNLHERIYLGELLDGSTLDFYPDLQYYFYDGFSAYSVSYGGALHAHGITDFHIDCFFGAKPGKGYIQVSSRGEIVNIEVTVKYTLWQWFCYIFLGGWIWMK